MCGNCKAAGPDVWICSQCGTRNGIRFNITCTKCRHSLISKGISGVVIPHKSSYKQEIPPR
jgi:hypothetical protein